ncbi:MAG: hypothetical protein PHQ75_03815 [Thermoguttaceae bacterium]|nr:hypothetical protein [Thermoguttaceae bacterium]
MRYTNILARFLSLLDISILLVGLFVILLSLAYFQREQKQARLENKKDQTRISMSVLDTVLERNLELITIYAGCEGVREGHCYLLGPDFVPGREIDTDHPDDFEYLASRRKEGTHAIVFLVSEEGAWDTFWTKKKIAELEKIWGCHVVYVPNVHFPQAVVEGVLQDE